MSDEAGPSNLPPVNDAPEQTSADQQLADVEVQLAALLRALQASQAAAAPVPLPHVAQTPPQQDGNPPPLVVASQFMAPIAPLNSPAVCSKCGVTFVPEVPDKCQSLIQSLVKVDREKV
ncbi:hypothetical protein B0H13DRAFT_1919383 [Mycena leptocephala]|nr:hypothetical protein B0H13DRAFT_1919383 [Mycena leptocephala]